MLRIGFIMMPFTLLHITMLNDYSVDWWRKPFSLGWRKRIGIARETSKLFLYLQPRIKDNYIYKHFKNIQLWTIKID